MQKHGEGASDVARLRQQITLECEAMNRALNGYAIVAKHDIIAHRHRALYQYHEQLVQLVGKKTASEISVHIYDQTVESD
jgi:hypothetical protein